MAQHRGGSDSEARGMWGLVGGGVQEVGQLFESSETRKKKTKQKKKKKEEEAALDLQSTSTWWRAKI